MKNIVGIQWYITKKIGLPSGNQTWLGQKHQHTAMSMEHCSKAPLVDDQFGDFTIQHIGDYLLVICYIAIENGT